MKAVFAIGLASLVVACTSQIQRISVLPTEPGFGDAHARCEFYEDDLVLNVTASCVVDAEKRVVVTNLENGQVLFDTQAAAVALPNFPVEQYAVVRLPCRCGRALRGSKHLVLVSLSGKCGREHASGSFRCATRPSER